MIFKDSRFQLGIVILDDLGKSRKEIWRILTTSFSEYLRLKDRKELENYVVFMPENLFVIFKGTGYFRDSSYIDASDFLHEDERMNYSDLVVIDINWAPGEGNIDGVSLAEIVCKRRNLAKLIFTGSEKVEVRKALHEKIPHIVERGYHFYPDIFKKPEDFNIDKFNEVIEYVMKVFKKKRAKYIKHNCHASEILRLIKKPTLSECDTLSIKDQNKQFQKVPLKNIFFECHTTDQFRKVLKKCFQAKSRFETMMYFWSHNDIKLASHINELDEKKRGTELLKDGTFKEKSLYKATQFFHQEIEPEFGEQEIKVIKEFFKDVDELIKRFGIDRSQTDSLHQIVNNYIEELYNIGSKLKRRTRFYLDELKKIFEEEHNVNFPSAHLDNEWYCYVGDFIGNPSSFSLEDIGDDGIKGHLKSLVSTLSQENRFIESHDKRQDHGLVVLEIKGKLSGDPKHKSNGGAFDLHHSSLQERIMNGNNLKKMVQLLPYYFMPFLVESFGEDGEWHCVNFSVTSGGDYEEITPEQFSQMVGLKPLNREPGKETGVRYLLGIEKVLE